MRIDFQIGQRHRRIVTMDIEDVLSGQFHRLGEYADEGEAARVCRTFRAAYMPYATE